MTESPGTVGSARTTTVLDPGFLQGIKVLPTDEVRRRRDESFAEREFQSYLRRQVQATRPPSTLYRPTARGRRVQRIL